MGWRVSRFSHGRMILERYPVPALILSQFTHEGADLTLKALRLGAMDFVDKSTKGPMDFLALTSEIIAKVKAIAHNRPKQLTYETSLLPERGPRGIVEVVALGASTGGPPALEMILRRFPKEINFGFLIVQHMPKGFTATLAERLDSICSIHVKEAEERDRIEPGIALIAPSGLHMKVRKGRGSVRLDLEPMNFIHRPSVDVLFQSVGEAYGSRSIGVILTGMGSDGVKGMSIIKERGGLTLAQDEQTSVVFGMPRVAINSGVVDKVVPLTDMAKEILRNI
jgi:two-component system chemotaxis response regulator CheB